MARVRVQQSRSLSPAEKADIKVAKAAAAETGSAADQLLRFGELGDQPPMAAASGAMIACGLAFRDRRMTRAGVRMLAALGLATLLKSAVKNNIDRTRPGEVIDKQRYRLRPGESKQGHLRSMPSGHSAGAAAVLLAAARDYPSARVPLIGGAVAIAAAQLPSRNHFLTDVAAGLALGLLSEWLASNAVDQFDQAIA
jgi:membrane-associated phospholipid phosphatase